MISPFNENDATGHGNSETRERRKQVSNSLPDSAIPAMHMYSFAAAAAAAARAGADGGAETYLVVRTAASRLPAASANSLRATAALTSLALSLVEQRKSEFSR